MTHDAYQRPGTSQSRRSPPLSGAGRPLPHEAWFGLLLAVTWARLGATVGFGAGLTISYLTAGLLGVGLIAACAGRPDDLRWRHRLVYANLLMAFGYFTMGPVVAGVDAGKRDLLLQALDRRLIGGNLSVMLEPLARPWMGDLMSLCYVFFYPYFIGTMLWYGTREVVVLRRVTAGIVTIYAIGYFGYSFVPASGPILAMTGAFRGPLPGGWITAMQYAFYRAASNGVDVFPSLHTATTVFLLAMDRRHAPRRFRVALLPVAGLVAATIWLRLHYFVDVVAGAALAAYGVRVARRGRIW